MCVLVPSSDLCTPCGTLWYKQWKDFLVLVKPSHAGCEVTDLGIERLQLHADTSLAEASVWTAGCLAEMLVVRPHGGAVPAGVQHLRAPPLGRGAGRLKKQSTQEKAWWFMEEIGVESAVGHRDSQFLLTFWS